MSILTAADQRSLTGVAAAFSWQPLDGDGIAATPAGAVTVDISRANGTSLVTGGATGGAGSNPRTYSLAASSCLLTDVLTAVWKDAGVERARTTMELVGGYYASVAQIQASDPLLADTSKYPTADIIRARTEVEQAFESLTRCDFAPRYHIERLDGTGTNRIVLGWGPIRSVRSVTHYIGSTPSTTFTAAQLLALPACDGRVLTSTDLSSVFLFGSANVVIEYESGYSALPFDLRDQFFIEVRKQLNDNKSAIQLATTFDYDGGPQIDPVLAAQQRRLFSTMSRYSLKTPGIA